MSGLDLSKKLWRIPQQGMVKGVCAGIAQYLDVPVKLVRRKASCMVKKRRAAESYWPPRIRSWQQGSVVCVKWNATSLPTPFRYAVVFASYN